MGRTETHTCAQTCIHTHRGSHTGTCTHALFSPASCPRAPSWPPRILHCRAPVWMAVMSAGLPHTGQGQAPGLGGVATCAHQAPSPSLTLTPGPGTCISSIRPLSTFCRTSQSSGLCGHPAQAQLQIYRNNKCWAGSFQPIFGVQDGPGVEARPGLQDTCIVCPQPWARPGSPPALGLEQGAVLVMQSSSFRGLRV